MMKVLAHRGDSGNAPQNTLPAFRQAKDKKADGIECDIHRSKDGVLVVCHDNNIASTSTGTGEIKDLTLAEMQQADFGSGFDPSFAGTTIPSLEQMLDVVKDMDLINIEMKEFGDFQTEALEEFYRIIVSYGCLSRVIVSSFDTAILDELKKLHGDVKTGLLYGEMEEPVAFTKAHGYDAIHPYLSSLTCETVQEALDNGLEVNVWTADTEEDIERAIALNCTGIISNYPERALRLVEKAGKR